MLSNQLDLDNQTHVINNVTTTTTMGEVFNSDTLPGWGMLVVVHSDPNVVLCNDFTSIFTIYHNWPNSVTVFCNAERALHAYYQPWPIWPWPV